MKVKMYRTMLDGCRYPSLVAENGSYVCDGRKTFTSPDTIYFFCKDQLGMVDAAEEYVYCFALDLRGKLMGLFEVSHGTVNSSLVSTREVFQKLLMLNATAFVVVHNHPSGDPSESKEDLDITKKLKNAGDVMNIELLDHIIIGDTYNSLRERGYV